METPDRAARRANEPGPTGRRAARNLERVRVGRALSQDQLAEAAGRLGRPLTRQMVSKTESGIRRIDVDDLVTFALALGTTPNRLLLTETADTDTPVELTSEASTAELSAWRWATGDQPLPPEFGAPQLPYAVDVDRNRWFTQMNRPHRPPGAPLGIQLRDHPDLVQRIIALVRDASEHGIELGQLHQGIDSAAFLTPARADDPQKETDGEG